MIGPPMHLTACINDSLRRVAASLRRSLAQRNVARSQEAISRTRSDLGQGHRCQPTILWIDRAKHSHSGCREMRQPRWR